MCMFWELNGTITRKYIFISANCFLKNLICLVDLPISRNLNLSYVQTAALYDCTTVYLTISGSMYISLFPFWGEGAITSNAIMNGFVYVSSTCMSISVGAILRRVVAGSKCVCILIDLSKLPSQKAMLIHNLQGCESAHFSTIVPTQIIINLCNFDQFKGQKMVCHCFHLHFPDYYRS